MVLKIKAAHYCFCVVGGVFKLLGNNAGGKLKAAESGGSTAQKSFAKEAKAKPSVKIL